MMVNKNVPWPDVSRPDAFARCSPRAQKAQKYFLQCIQQINNSALKTLCQEMLAPLHNKDCPWLLPQNKTAQAKDPALCARLEAPVNYPIFWGAPAAENHSHHCYPGGWLMHNATNLITLHSLMHTAQEIRDTPFNADAMLAAMILHDSLKPQLLLWKNGLLDADQGASGHHVAALAEGYLRGVPVDVLQLLAGVHSGWWRNPEGIARFLENAAALIDKPELAHVPPRIHFQIETWMMNQGEVSWYTATRSAYQEVKIHLQNAVEKLYPPEDQSGATWWVFAHYDELTLLRHIGDGTFEDIVRKVLLTTD